MSMNTSSNNWDICFLCERRAPKETKYALCTKCRESLSKEFGEWPTHAMTQTVFRHEYAPVYKAVFKEIFTDPKYVQMKSSHSTRPISIDEFLERDADVLRQWKKK